jgi:hypothetical protein
MKLFIMSNILLFLFIVFGGHVFGQIIIKNDSRLPGLVQSIANEAEKTLGYRLQICFDSNKDVADAAKRKFLDLYPKTEVYMIFEDPNFNLMVGDYRNKIDAEKVQAKIQSLFTICVIHRTEIHLPRVD